MNKSPIPIIKKAEIADALELSQLVITCWNEAYENILDHNSLKNLNKTVTADKYKKLLANDNNIYILWFENKMIGFVSFGQIRDSHLDIPQSNEIYAIYLRKLFWGRGFGKILLDFAEQQIIHQYQVKSIIIWCLEDNFRSHTFYTRNNYKPTQHRKEFTLSKCSYPEIMFLKQ